MAGKRRRAREAAFQALYQWDLKSWEDLGSTDDVLRSVHRGAPLPPAVEEYARRLVDGVVGHREEIDALLGKASHEWEVSRMATVDRNLLRLAICEILYEPEVPAAVIIDEALVLAKRFGDKGSSSFINALLDRVAKEQRGAKEQTA